jgi:hypothetical protein
VSGGEGKVGKIQLHTLRRSSSEVDGRVTGRKSEMRVVAVGSGLDGSLRCRNCAFLYAESRKVGRSHLSGSASVIFTMITGSG